MIGLSNCWSSSIMKPLMSAPLMLYCHPFMDGPVDLMLVICMDEPVVLILVCCHGQAYNFSTRHAL